MERLAPLWRLILAGGLTALATGCHLGPHALYQTRIQYNRSVKLTTDEEMLLNLVRLRYNESPGFMKVGSITSQHVWNQGLGASAGFKESAASTLGLSGALGRTERPTISYTPLRDSSFNQGLLEPITLDRLHLLSRTGWAIDRLMRVTIHNMNRVDNATSAGGPTPRDKPDFEEFTWATQVLRGLQKQQLIEVTPETKRDVKATNIAVVTAEDQIAATSNGLKFELKEGIGGAKDYWELVGKEEIYKFRIHPDYAFTPEVLKFKERLNLDDRLTEFELKSAKAGQIKSFGTGRNDIMISTRSVLEAMFFLSHGVEVPPEHYKKRLVTVTRDYDGTAFDWRRLTGDLLQIHHSKVRPTDGVTAVWYRGYWFHIKDCDRNSKATFMLLQEIFNIQTVIGSQGTGPLITVGA